ncbi:hypothetical protein VP01_828g1, partial [Puccinia sorghi]
APPAKRLACRPLYEAACGLVFGPQPRAIEGSGAMTMVITTRSGKDLVSSLVEGPQTKKGDLFGGALEAAAAHTHNITDPYFHLQEGQNRNRSLLLEVCQARKKKEAATGWTQKGFRSLCQFNNEEDPHLSILEISENFLSRFISLNTLKLASKSHSLTHNNQNTISLPKNPELSSFSRRVKYDLQFLSTFLHRSKEFLSPVRSASRSWGGLMWALGWRKSRDKKQIAGRYIKKFSASKMAKFNSVFQDSPRAGEILGKLFWEMGGIPFEKNQQLMKELNLPDFTNLGYHHKLPNLACSPHLTFTTDGFFNPPHVDKKDISEFAFVLFLPTFSADGKLAPPSSGYNISSGPFIFPDHQFGIDFSHQKGVVKMIWQANKYKHCTMPSDPNPLFTRLGISLQINRTLSNACQNYEDGDYDADEYYFGDHYYYLFRCLVKTVTLICCSMLFLFV